ncbi:MAG: hypothetical protein LBT40_14380, partial [Deltaproteobacteria bacterium]|nr:hypothetical protein [Deltaproteobacteria bacterium]
MIVEFLEDNLFVDGWVQSTAPGGKLEIVAGPRTIRLQPKRILVSMDVPDPRTPDGRAALVAAADARRAELASHVDLEVIWGLLDEEQAEAAAAAVSAPRTGGAAGTDEAAGTAEGAGEPGTDGQDGSPSPAESGGKDAGPADVPGDREDPGARPLQMPASSDPASRFTYEALAELEYGRGATPDQTAAVMRAIHREGLHFKFTPEAALKRSREEIARVLEIRAREARKAELRREGIVWMRQSRVAYFGKGPGDAARPSGTAQDAGPAPDAAGTSSPAPEAGAQDTSVAPSTGGPDAGSSLDAAPDAAQDSSPASDAGSTLDAAPDAAAQDASPASDAGATLDAAPDAAAQDSSPASDAGSTLDAAPDAAAQDA